MMTFNEFLQAGGMTTILNHAVSVHLDPISMDPENIGSNYVKLNIVLHTARQYPQFSQNGGVNDMFIPHSAYVPSDPFANLFPRYKASASDDLIISQLNGFDEELILTEEEVRFITGTVKLEENAFTETRRISFEGTCEDRISPEVETCLQNIHSPSCPAGLKNPSSLVNAEELTFPSHPKDSTPHVTFNGKSPKAVVCGESTLESRSDPREEEISPSDSSQKDTDTIHVSPSEDVNDGLFLSCDIDVFEDLKFEGRECGRGKRRRIEFIRDACSKIRAGFSKFGKRRCEQDSRVEHKGEAVDIRRRRGRVQRLLGKCVGDRDADRDNGCVEVRRTFVRRRLSSRN